MPSNTINIRVEDIATILLTYNRIQLERANSVGGTYTLLTTITLATDDYTYAYTDTTGALTSWYRYRYYHATTLAASDYSNPFRPDGLNRLKIRQEMIKRWRLGLIFTSDADGSITSISTDDSRIKSSRYPADRGKGQWLNFVSGTEIGKNRVITASSPTAGTFTINPAIANALLATDEVEWLWLADPEVYNDAINRGLRRYWFLERVPITGVANQDDYNLEYLPWLEERKQITGLWYFPMEDVTSPSHNLESAWGSNGKWWGTRQDSRSVTLSIYPRITTTDTLYLEAYRRMPELFTDDSVAPIVCNLELAAALGYDELLAYLMNPVFASLEEQDSFGRARALLQPRLRGLMRLHKARPNFGPVQLSHVSNFIQPYRAR